VTAVHSNTRTHLLNVRYVLVLLLYSYPTLSDFHVLSLAIFYCLEVLSHVVKIMRPNWFL